MKKKAENVVKNMVRKPSLQASNGLDAEGIIKEASSIVNSHRQSLDKAYFTDYEINNSLDF